MYVGAQSPVLKGIHNYIDQNLVPIELKISSFLAQFFNPEHKVFLDRGY
jgi:hypothetical protein